MNIAIIRHRKPAAGVIYVPDKNVLYYALNNLGSFKADSTDGIESVISQATDPTTEIAAEAIENIIDASTEPRHTQIQC